MDPGSSSSWPTHIQAITLIVDDLEEAKEFYRRAFGLPVHFEDPDSAVFDVGGTFINLLIHQAAPELIAPAEVAPRSAGSRAVLTIGVEDVDAVAAQLESNGVTLLNGPVDRPWGPRTASFIDPNGFIWEIAH